MRRDSCRHLDLDLLARLDAGRALDGEHLAVDAHAEGLAGPDAGRHDDPHPALRRLLRLHLRLHLLRLHLLLRVLLRTAHAMRVERAPMLPLGLLLPPLLPLLRRLLPLLLPLLLLPLLLLPLLLLLLLPLGRLLRGLLRGLLLQLLLLLRFLRRLLRLRVRPRARVRARVRVRVPVRVRVRGRVTGRSRRAWSRRSAFALPVPLLLLTLPGMCETSGAGVPGRLEGESGDGRRVARARAATGRPRAMGTLSTW